MFDIVDVRANSDPQLPETRGARDHASLWSLERQGHASLWSLETPEGAPLQRFPFLKPRRRSRGGEALQTVYDFL